MKRLSYVVLFTALLAMIGCATTPPVELKPITPNLNIAQSDVRPLLVAVVVQDPMSYTFFYQGEGSYSRDMTAEMRTEGLLLERDLSKVVYETFSQIFKQVVVLRDLPQPGQYDAVVEITINRILNQEHVVLTGETCDITAEWSMTVLNGKNSEIFRTRGISPSHNYGWSAFNPGPGWINGINTNLSLILSELANEWSETLYKLKIPGS
ncbi:MAG: hypothetical protein JW736_05560 [Deltaproteobacteria bacterium]|nr:hypothetical protein [Deltaproteobacteria bacterium]MBN2688702.1 hypothetical protein [Deltaproteobacteria bacterium]